MECCIIFFYNLKCKNSSTNLSAFFVCSMASYTKCHLAFECVTHYCTESSTIQEATKESISICYRSKVIQKFVTSIILYRRRLRTVKLRDHFTDTVIVIFDLNVCVIIKLVYELWKLFNKAYGNVTAFICSTPRLCEIHPICFFFIFFSRFFKKLHLVCYVYLVSLVEQAPACDFIVIYHQIVLVSINLCCICQCYVYYVFRPL